MVEEQKNLIKHVAELDEEKALELVRHRLDQGEDPWYIINECQIGMQVVGEHYSEGSYYISGLIMAGEILRQVMDLITPSIKSFRSDERQSGVILLGTVQNDIHDLGKNIFKMLLATRNYTVHDLGVNVSADQFAAAAAEIKPDIVGLSGLVTAAYNSMKDTIKALEEEARCWPKPLHIVIGGSQIDEQVSKLVGSKYWANKADEGVRICTRLLSE